MAAVLDSIKNFVFGKANEDYEDNYDEAYEEDAYFNGGYDDEEEEEEPVYERNRNRFRSENRFRRTSFFRNEENDGYSYDEPVNNSHSQSPARIVLVRAKHFSEAKRIAENLKQGRSVVINFEDMEKGEAKRTIDFLSGTAWGKDGKIQKISHCTIIFAVGPVDLIGRIEEIADAENYFSF
ncbi:MAG: cell division protein SepF [Firmicutes bacterium]|nr:cell division protein SepF [Bacillota bacterium]